MTRIEFPLPDVGEGLTESTVAQWFVAVGDEVAVEQPLVEVETAKSVAEITSPYAGTVVELGGPEGAELQVGSLLVAFTTEGEAGLGADGDDSSDAGCSGDRSGEAAGTADVRAGRTAGEAVQTASPADRQPSVLPGGRVLASPATRRKARQSGVDIRALTGTGPAGRVTRDDVERAAAGSAQHSAPAPTTDAAPNTAAASSAPLDPTAAAPSASAATFADDPVRPRESRTEQLGTIRRQVARTMQQSWQTIPHITEFRNVDARALNQARQVLRENAPAGAPKLTALPILVRAVAVALRKNPTLNASIDMDAQTVTYHGPINVGIATSSEQGLVVPVVRDADRLGVYQISAEIDRLATAVRDRRATVHDLSGGTFTVSNFGSYGTVHGMSIIKPPEVGIVGFGRVHDEVVPVDGQPVVRPVQPVSVSADHRLVDGDVMGAFVGDLVALIEEPVLLLGGV